MEGFAAHQWGPLVILGIVVSIVVHQLPIQGKRNQPTVQNSEHGSAIVDVAVSSTGQSSQVSWPLIEPCFASLVATHMQNPNSNSISVDMGLSDEGREVATEENQILLGIDEEGHGKFTRDESKVEKMHDPRKLAVGDMAYHVFDVFPHNQQEQLASHALSFIESIASSGIRNFITSRGLWSKRILELLCVGCVVLVFICVCLRFLLKVLGNSANAATETRESESTILSSSLSRGLSTKGKSKFGKTSSWDGREKDEASKRKAEALAKRSDAAGSLTLAGADSKSIERTSTSTFDTSMNISDDESRSTTAAYITDILYTSKSIVSKSTARQSILIHNRSCKGFYSTEESSDVPQSSDDPEVIDDFKKEFQLAAPLDNENKPLYLSWLTPEEAANEGLPHACMPMDFAAGYDQAEVAEAADFERITAPWTPQALQQLFAKYEIDASSWKEEKVQALATELETEKSFLMVTSMQQLRLVIDVLEILIVNPNTGDFLVGKNEVEVTPCIRRNAGETIPQAARRCLRERMGLASTSIAFNWTMVKSTDAEETSDDFLGITTIKRKRCLCGKLVKKISSSDQSELLQMWTWKPLEQVLHLAKMKAWIKQVIHDPSERKSVPENDSQSPRSRITRQLTLSRQRTFQTSGTSSLSQSRGGGGISSKGGDSMGLSSMGRDVGISSRRQQMSRMRTHGSLRLEQHDDLKPVVPWTEQEVKTLLAKYSTDASDFGMTLEDLSAAASFDSLYFCRRCSDDQLVCVRDEVLLRLISPDCQLLLARKGSNTRLNANYQWLKCMKRLDESAWDTVRRLLRMQLSMENRIDAVELGLTPQEVGCEGDRVVSKMWILSGHIPSSKKSLCDHLFPDSEAP